MITSKHLALDSRVIARTENAVLRPAPVVKDPHNPLLCEDMRWEVRFDNLYANVVYDAAGRVWKLWYNPFIIDDVTTNTSPEEKASSPYKPAFREMGVCYAWSHDGITWHKPALGVFEFDGNRANNLVMRDVHGVGVTMDQHERDGRRRFRALHHTGTGWSRDGLRWQLRDCPEMEAVGDTHNNCLYVPQRNAWVGFTRTWDGGRRIVARTESTDFVTWTKAENVMEALPGERHRQTYAMPVFPYAGVYLGLVMLFNTEDDTVDCELAWSPDTVSWKRVCPGTPIIPRGEKGAFDWGCIYAALAPVNDGEHLRLYYGGSDDTHGAWRAGALGLARMRRDGFAGFAAVDRQSAAVVETAPVTCTGRKLVVSADAAAGSLKAAVVGEERLDEAACRPITENVTDGTVSWRDADLSHLIGKEIALRFTLENASLYSFGFAD